MPAFNFQKLFAPDIESGKKRQTIRTDRKDGRRPASGQTAFLYTGMRTSACRKLGEHIIQMVQRIMIGHSGCIINYDQRGEYPITDLTQLNLFARDDGFADWQAMVNWFDKTHGLPVEGDLIKW